MSNRDPDLRCPKCGQPVTRVASIRDGAVEYRCANGHKVTVERIEIDDDAAHS